MSTRPCLVLLHAFGASADAWNAVGQRLSPDFDLTALNLPGFGGRQDDLHAQSVRDYGAWVVDEIGRRGLKTYILVGWSMGGKIALSAALRSPQGLRGLILVAPSPPGPEPMEPGAREAERNSFGDPQATREALNMAAADGFADAPLNHAVAQRLMSARSAWDFWLDIGSKEDLSQEVQHLRLPMLVLTGDEDEHLGSAAVASHIKPKLFNVEERVIQGSGHLIPYEAPRALADEIRRWTLALSDHARAAPKSGWRQAAPPSA